MRHHLLALLGAFALLFAAGPVSANAGVTTLNPDESADVVTATLAAGDSIEYSWSTGLSVQFRITRGGVEVFTASNPVGQGTYAVTVAGTYVVSFYNAGAFLTIISWTVQPRVQPSILPLLVGGAAAGVAGITFALLVYQRRRRRTGRPMAYLPTTAPSAGPPDNPGG